MDVIVERFQRRKIVSDPASPMLYYLRQKPKTCGTVDIDVLAASIQKNCAMTKGDVKHVIEALVEEIQGNLANGDKVKLNQLGTFHMTFRCPCLVPMSGVGMQVASVSATKAVLTSVGALPTHAPFSKSTPCVCLCCCC